MLSDPLAAQFGPSMLGDERSFQEACKGNCFSQLGAKDLVSGSVPWQCWRSIPEWMRCSMVVVSTGPGGNGVAFHKHGTAWLGLFQGVKRWWLYPPQGPPKPAYEAVALAAARDLPEACAGLRPEHRPLEIRQAAGDCVFVPALWWHATLDEEPTLGIGSQFSMAEINILQCQEQHPHSGFALYHAACEVHKTEEEKAIALFEAAIQCEPLNFYFATNQVLFYLNMVFHPKLTISIITRLMGKIERLDPQRQMIVQRFFIPTVCNFVEWHSPHDRLLKYSVQAAQVASEALVGLLQPMLPGGQSFRLGSSLPWDSLGFLEYRSQCFHCKCMAMGKAGDPGSVRAHRFFCFRCVRLRDEARCFCGQRGAGQLGMDEEGPRWFCPSCWKRAQIETPKRQIEEKEAKAAEKASTVPVQKDVKRLQVLKWDIVD